MQMTGNTVLVTGGGTGIGRGLAESLHRLGNQVLIAGRRQEPLQAVAEANPGIQYLSLDQGDPVSIRRFAAELTDRYPDHNVLINNAGIQRVEDLATGDTGAADVVRPTSSQVRVVVGSSSSTAGWRRPRTECTLRSEAPGSVAADIDNR